MNRRYAEARMNLKSKGIKAQNWGTVCAGYGTRVLKVAFNMSNFYVALSVA